jgi:hypothetical protein
VDAASQRSEGSWSAAWQRDLRLFWIAATMLFFEIMLIRWLSAEIRIFAYFHNLILLFAFLGIGLGAIAARREREFPLLLSLAIASGLIVLVAAHRYLGPFSLKNLSYLLSSGTSSIRSTASAPWSPAR